MEQKILHNLRDALKGKKLIRLAHTVDEGLDQTVLDIPQEIWYKYPTMGEDFIKMEMEKKGIKCIRPFPNSHRDRDYFFDHLIWKMISDKYIEKMQEEPIFFTYKNSTNLDEACFDYGFKKLMPDYKLFKELQYKSNLEAYGVTQGNGLIPFINRKISDTSYKEVSKILGDKFVVQFSFSDTGWNTAGSHDTHIIESDNDFVELQAKEKRDSDAKISKFIDGYGVCMNVVNTSKGTVVSDLYLQVTGEPNLTDSNIILSGANLVESYKIIPRSVQKKSEDIARTIGGAMHKKGYKGHFGIDFIVDHNTNEIYVLEINPRFTGSTFMHTFLADRHDKLPLLAIHLSAYLECLPESFNITDYENEMRGIWEGGSFYVRNREDSTVQIVEAPKPGLYKIKGNSIEFVREEYNFKNMPTKDHFLVNKIYSLKRNIEPRKSGQHLCKIYSLEKVFDGDKRLLDKYKMVNDVIYKMFKFTPKDTYDSSVPYKVI